MVNTDQHTPRQMIRIDRGTWDVFGRMAGKRSRSQKVREFIEWYVGMPGAELPERPTAVTERSTAA